VFAIHKSSLPYNVHVEQLSAACSAKIVV